MQGNCNHAKKKIQKVIPQKIIDEMEIAEKRFWYAHERFILYGRGYDKLAMKNITQEMRFAERALRKIYKIVIKINKNGRAK